MTIGANGPKPLFVQQVNGFSEAPRQTVTIGAGAYTLLEDTVRSTVAEEPAKILQFERLLKTSSVRSASSGKQAKYG
jgi:hypothetical protein